MGSPLTALLAIFFHTELSYIENLEKKFKINIMEDT